MEGVVRRLNFANKLVMNPEGIAGGLVLMWTEEVKIRVISSNKNLIDVECSDPNSGNQMRITFLYAPTNYGERLTLWHQLRGIQATSRQ